MSYKPRRYRSQLNFAIERELRLAGITIPFPQRDLHMISPDNKERFSSPDREVRLGQTPAHLRRFLHGRTSKRKDPGQLDLRSITK